MMIDRGCSKRMRVIVVGGGPAGLSAAIWAARLGLSPHVYEKAQIMGGQLPSYSLPITDLPGFGPGSANQLIHQLQAQARGLGIAVFMGEQAIDWDGQQLWLSGQSAPHQADWLFYAPGLRMRSLDIPGQEWLKEPSVSEVVEAEVAHVLVVGGGDRAVEGAARLAEAGHKVTLLVRSNTMRARQQYQQRVRDAGVRVRYRTTLVALKPSERGGFQAQLADDAGHQGWQGQHVLIRIGMEPDILPKLATVRGDRAWAKQLRMSIVGDAALAPWERSLTTAFASGMQAVKEALSHLEAMS